MMQLKYDHCLRVAREARDLAVDLRWSEDDIRVAEIVGLFHDVGRFSQYQQYQTYHDPDSVNHGCRGFQVLRDDNWLAECDGREQELILESVRLHNCHHLPAALTDDLQRFVHLIRDADKLDIFYVLNNAIEREALKDNPGIIWNLPLDAPPSPVILENLRRRQQADYRHVKSQADFCLLQLCWIYDLNYLPTRRRVAERHIIDRVARTLPEDVRSGESIKQVKTYLAEACAQPR